MNLRPVEAEDFDQEHFDEAVAAKHVQGQLRAGAGQPSPAARLVFHQPGIGEGFDHCRYRAGDHAHHRCQLAHGDQLLGAFCCWSHNCLR